MMYGGELIALADPDSLRSCMPGYLLQVDCDQPALAQQALKDMSGVLDTTIHGALLHICLANPKLQNQVANRLVKAKITIRTMETTQPSLEDVFLFMVQQHQAQHPA